MILYKIKCIAIKLKFSFIYFKTKNVYFNEFYFI